MNDKPTTGGGTPPPPKPKTFIDEESDRKHLRQVRHAALEEANFAVATMAANFRHDNLLTDDGYDAAVLERAKLFETYLSAGFDAAMSRLGKRIDEQEQEGPF